jgi:predicted small integral membrane protein
MATSSSSSDGIGFTGLLTVLFVGLKLTGYIHWSWWWVLSPLWIGAGISIVFILGVLWLLNRDSKPRKFIV